VADGPARSKRPADQNWTGSNGRKAYAVSSTSPTNNPLIQNLQGEIATLKETVSSLQTRIAILEQATRPSGKQF